VPDWLPSDDEICDAMRWSRNRRSAALDAARHYLAAIAQLIDAWKEPPNARFLRLENGTASWAPHGPGALHRCLAASLHRRASGRVASLGLPAEVGTYYAEDLGRIGQELTASADADFSFKRYHFKADLRILALRRIPMGMYSLDGAAIPRQILIRQWPRAGWRLQRVVLECGGLAPFFSQHMVPHRVHLFSPDRRAHYLELLGEVLKSRPQIRGLMSTAWYNDPVVAKISPHLAYLREGLERLGAQTFRIGTTTEVVEDALAKSATRRRLHASGEYVPTAFLIVVPRRSLLQAFDIPDARIGHAS